MKAPSWDAFILKRVYINVKCLYRMLNNAYSVFLRERRNSAAAGEKV